MRKALLAGVAAAALFGAGAGAHIFLSSGGAVAVVRHAVDALRDSPAAGMAIGWTSEEETKAALVLRNVSVHLDSGQTANAAQVAIEPHGSSLRIAADDITVVSLTRHGVARIGHADLSGISIAGLPGLPAALTPVTAIHALDGARLSASGISVHSGDPGGALFHVSMASFGAALKDQKLVGIHAGAVAFEGSGVAAVPYLPAVGRTVTAASYVQDGVDLGGLLADSREERIAAVRDGFGIGRIDISGVRADRCVIDTIAYEHTGPFAFDMAIGPIHTDGKASSQEKALFGDAGFQVRRISVRGRRGVFGFAVDIPQFAKVEARSEIGFDLDGTVPPQPSRVDVRIEDLGMAEASERLGLPAGDRSGAAAQAASLVRMQLDLASVVDRAGTVGRFQEFVGGQTRDFALGLLIGEPETGYPARTFTLVEPQSTRVE
jgi:hypothetical protein